MARPNSKTLVDRIEKAIDAEITRNLGSIVNPVLRASIEDLLRDAAYDKMMTALDANPPKALDVVKAVQESLEELSQSVLGLKKAPLADNFKKAGKEAKPAPVKKTPTPRASPSSYGGKYSRSYGGK